MHCEKLCSKCKTAVHKSSSAIPGMEILYVIRDTMLYCAVVCEFLVLNQPAGDIALLKYIDFMLVYTCSLKKYNEFLLRIMIKVRNSYFVS